jgi:NADH-quinone oxidoreductase subunit E
MRSDSLLAEKYAKEISAILAKYPTEQRPSAVLALLYLAQHEYGRITAESIIEISEILGMQPTEVASLVSFYTLLHDEDGGKYRIQICTDFPCAMRGAEEFARELCERLEIPLGGTTPDGLITVEEVKCLAACDRAPMFQLQDATGIHYHENQSVDLALELIEALRTRSADA